MRPDQRADGDSDLEAPATTSLVPSAFAVPPQAAVTPEAQTRASLGALAFGILGGFVGGALAALIVAGVTGLATDPVADKAVPLVVGMENRVGALESGQATARNDLEGLRGRIETLEARPLPPEDAATASAESLGALEARVTVLEQGDNRFEEIERRVAALEGLGTRVDTLQRRVEQQPLDRRSAQAVALAALQSALSRGAPFANELATVERLADKPDPRLDGLKPHAEAGIATAAVLRRELPSVGDAVTVAATRAEADGVLERLLANARSTVRVRTTTATEGSSPEAILSRVAAALEAAESERALEEWKSLPETARKAASGFEEKLAARAAADRTMTALTAELAAPSAE